MKTLLAIVVLLVIAGVCGWFYFYNTSAPAADATTPNAVLASANRVIRLGQVLEQQKRSVAIAAKKIASLESFVKDGDTRIERAQVEINTAQTALDRSSGQGAQYRSLYTRATEDLQRANRHLEEARAYKAEKLSQLEGARSELTAATNRLTNICEEIARDQKQVTSLQSQSEPPAAADEK